MTSGADGVIQDFYQQQKEKSEQEDIKENIVQLLLEKVGDKILVRLGDKEVIGEVKLYMVETVGEISRQMINIKVENNYET